MNSKEKKSLASVLKSVPKPVGIGIFWGICILVGIMVVSHNNPLAPDIHTENLKKFCACALLLLACVIFSVYYDRMFIIPRELFQSRELIWKLAKNDFKKRYAGSYLGFLWALVQPVVTVAMYYVVFDVIFNTRSEMVASGVEVPYVLFLTAGLVPWFYFSEALSNGTNALLEYNYLVKKVVFDIDILPIVKVLSAIFIHIFFVCFMLVLNMCYGRFPDLYTLQILYYSLCMVLMVLAVCYLTSALVVFFLDLSQIVAIFLQVGIWMTPIMWQLDRLDDMPVIQKIFKLNPMYYIVSGYRDALFDKVYFWEHPWLTAYFWILLIVLVFVGTKVFKKLKVHFADVL